MVTPTRFSPPGSIQLITHRTTQGEFLLRPDRAITQNCYYLIGCMQQRYSIEFHSSEILSNHSHLLITDLLGDQVQAFNRDFFSLLARSTNCYRGRSENLFNTGKPSCVHVAPRAEDVIDKSAYITVNVVEAELVSHAKKWPGVRVLPRELGRLVFQVRRPEFFYDEHGSMPEEVTVRFTIPRVWDEEPEQLRKRISEECNRREAAIRERAREAGRTFLGAKRVLRRSVRSTPSTSREWLLLTPHVACKQTSLRVRFIEWRRKRQQRYDELRQLLLEGVRGLVFPEGTYALHYWGGQNRDPWAGCIWRRLASEP